MKYLVTISEVVSARSPGEAARKAADNIERMPSSETLRLYTAPGGNASNTLQYCQSLGGS